MLFQNAGRMILNLGMCQDGSDAFRVLVRTKHLNWECLVKLFLKKLNAETSHDLKGNDMTCGYIIRLFTSLQRFERAYTETCAAIQPLIASSRVPQLWSVRVGIAMACLACRWADIRNSDEKHTENRLNTWTLVLPSCFPWTAENCLLRLSECSTTQSDRYCSGNWKNKWCSRMLPACVSCRAVTRT